jgi:uncharacterized glyoxalase superfamily protein PhnB
MATWLVHAFGMSESVRLRDGEGRVSHVELRYRNGALLLGTPGPQYRSPASHRLVCASADAWLSTEFVVDGVLIRVDDVDAHHEAAVEAGASILTPPTDSGPGRVYRAADPEGHRWMFLQDRGDE